MAVTVICDKTGIAFEAASRRQKNHPEVSSLLNWSAQKCKPGAYGVALEMFSQCRAEGMTDIDTIIAQARAAVVEFNEAASEAEWRRMQQQKTQQRARQAQYVERANTNAILRNAGYRWLKEDEESMDAFGADAFQERYGNAAYVWLLIAPDGREVSVKQAMTELAAAGNASAAMWMEKR